MVTYVSSYTKCHPNYLITSDKEIEDALDFVDYDGYVPKQVLRDLINMASYHVLEDDASKALDLPLEFNDALLRVFNKLSTSIIDNINSPLYVATSILKKLSISSLDFRSVEYYRESGLSLTNCWIPTFNYKFNIKEITDELAKFLNITQEHKDQIEKLPNEIIDVLNFVNGVGKSLYPSRLVSETNYKRMESHGQIAKTNLTKTVRPDFKPKFANKDLDVKSTKDKTEYGKSLIVAFSTSIKHVGYIQYIYKLIGALVITHRNAGLIGNDVLLYLDVGNTIVEVDIYAMLHMFEKNAVQLSMFNRSNTEFLSHVTALNKNSTILFIPNPEEPCAIMHSVLKGCRINMITKYSKYLNRYKYMCSKTGGKVIVI